MLIYGTRNLIAPNISGARLARKSDFSKSSVKRFVNSETRTIIHRRTETTINNHKIHTPP